MARPTNNKKTRRLNLEMSEAVRERLDTLKDQTEADSLSEVIRRALAVYAFMWERSADGETVIVRNSDGEETRVEFIWH